MLSFTNSNCLETNSNCLEGGGGGSGETTTPSGTTYVQLFVAEIRVRMVMGIEMLEGPL